MSIVFDRAVEYYDQTRSLSVEQQRVLIESLLRYAGVNHDSRVLEIGVGTGRIALDIAKSVRRLSGVDLSWEMMGVLRRKLVESDVAIDLAQANALYLPFSEGTFDVAYAVHVYHLVQHWQAALRDARRVLKEGGRFVVSFHKRNTHTPNVLMRKEMHRLAREYGVETKRPGAESEDEIYQEVLNWDPELQIIKVAEWDEVETPGEILTNLDNQLYSETWMIPRDVMDALMPRLREWTIENYGDLSQSVPVEYETRWLVAQKR
jgi:ubiquinone/menaquinone biosynthesis C-methylase UbiE